MQPCLNLAGVIVSLLETLVLTGNVGICHVHYCTVKGTFVSLALFRVSKTNLREHLPFFSHIAVLTNSCMSQIRIYIRKKDVITLLRTEMVVIIYSATMLKVCSQQIFHIFYDIYLGAVTN